MLPACYNCDKYNNGIVKNNSRNREKPMGVQDGLVKCCVSGRRTCPVPVWHERAGQQPGKTFRRAYGENARKADQQRLEGRTARCAGYGSNQSSSATTVVSLASSISGILKLRSCIGVIMGCKYWYNGYSTRFCVWAIWEGSANANFFLTLLKPTTLAPIIAVVGIIF